MRVDAARHDDAPAGVDLAQARLPCERTRSGHGRDGLPADRDVASHDPLGRDNITAANDDVEHEASQPSRRQSSNAPNDAFETYTPGLAMSTRTNAIPRLMGLIERRPRIEAAPASGHGVAISRAPVPVALGALAGRMRNVVRVRLRSRVARPLGGVG
jgi:hypothetical protein